MASLRCSHLYPAVAGTGDFVATPDPSGVYDAATSTGRHEVVIESPEHARR